MQCGAVWCSVMQYVAAKWFVFRHGKSVCFAECYSVSQRVAVCCSVVQCVAARWLVLEPWHFMCVAVFCSVSQRVAVCCSVLQRGGSCLRDDRTLSLCAVALSSMM